MPQDRAQALRPTAIPGLPVGNAATLLDFIAAQQRATRPPLPPASAPAPPMSADAMLMDYLVKPGARALGWLFQALDAPPSRAYPTNMPYASPLRVLGAANATLPAAAGLVADAVTGQRPTAPVVSPMAPIDEQATFAGEAERRGLPSMVRAAGTLADLLVGPEHGLAAAVPLLASGAKLAHLAQGARASRADNVAAGLYHAVGEGKKLPMPVEAMRFTYEPTGATAAPVQTVPVSALEGAALIPATGDRSRAAQRLTSVGDVPTDVPLHGGPDFMRTHAADKMAWASTRNALQKLSKQADAASQASRAAGGSGDVYLVYMPQSHAAVDFSTFMSDALMQQVQAARITQRTAKDFDATLRRSRPEWLGLRHPEASRQLAANGELRHAFVNTAKLDAFEQRGFPNVAMTRAALIEPALMDVPAYHGGYAVAKLDPSKGITTSAPNPHPTYDAQLPGTYVGGLAAPVPPELLFADFFRGRRAAGADPARDVRSFMLSNPIQVATPDWVRRNADYLRTRGAVSVLLPAVGAATAGAAARGGAQP